MMITQVHGRGPAISLVLEPMNFNTMLAPGFGGRFLYMWDDGFIVVQVMPKRSRSFLESKAARLNNHNLPIVRRHLINELKGKPNVTENDSQNSRIGGRRVARAHAELG